jgi:hypothetical protein
MDKDFSKVMFKVNTSGSWANIALVNYGQYDAVKAACEVIAKASTGRIRFKVLDAEGGVTEEYGPTPPNGISEWHEPRIRRN